MNETGRLDAMELFLLCAFFLLIGLIVRFFWLLIFGG